MRHTRAHTGNRRSHHALKGMRFSVTKEGTTHPRHRVVLDGSTYRGRSVMDKKSARLARSQKSQKRREKEDRPGPSKEVAVKEDAKKEKKVVTKKKKEEKE